MPQANSRNLLQKGIAAARAKDKVQARRFLLQVVKDDPASETGWLWLAVAAKSLEERVVCLQNALALNPNNEQTAAALKQIQAGAALQPPSWKCPICLTEAAAETDKCLACRAVLSLTDIDALLNNAGGVDRQKVHGAINRYRQALANGADADAHYYLGLAYLNVGQVGEGVTHLRAAMRLRPDDKTLQMRVGLLGQQLTAAKAALRERKRERGIVLTVDDSPTVVKLVRMTLQRHGYEVVVAANGMDALAKINDNLPDLILLDITMPRMDGYQLCKIIKSNQETKHIPVIMLSGKDGFFDKVRARVAGSTDYITKPFEPEVLLQTVRRHV